MASIPCHYYSAFRKWSKKDTHFPEVCFRNHIVPQLQFLLSSSVNAWQFRMVHVQANAAGLLPFRASVPASRSQAALPHPPTHTRCSLHEWISDKRENTAGCRVNKKQGHADFGGLAELEMVIATYHSVFIFLSHMLIWLPALFQEYSFKQIRIC